MQDNIVLPAPELLTTPEIVNLGPVIDPPFVDARQWTEFLTPVETEPVKIEEMEPTLTEEGSRQAVEVALSSEGARPRLEGKRYEVMGVGVRSVDRETEYPVVVIYSYTDDMVVEALVDLAAGKLVEVREERYQPPLASSELSEALALAQQDGRLPEAGIDVATGDGIVVDDENFRSPRYRHRIVDLRFGPADRRSPTAFAIVDLSSQEVIRAGVLREGESA